jgi:hypothetical protein
MMNYLKDLQRDIVMSYDDLKVQLYELGQDGDLYIQISKCRSGGMRYDLMNDWRKNTADQVDDGFRPTLRDLNIRGIMVELVKLTVDVITSAARSR